MFSFRYALEGLSSCQNIVVGTPFVARDVRKVFNDIGGAQSAAAGLTPDVIEQKMVVVPPGIDEQLFQILGGPVGGVSAVARLQARFLDAVKAKVEKTGNGRNGAAIVPPPLDESTASPGGMGKALAALCGKYNQVHRRPSLPATRSLPTAACDTVSLTHTCHPSCSAARGGQRPCGTLAAH